MVTLHDGNTHWALPIDTTFSDLDCISRTQQFCLKILCSYLIKLKLYVYWLHQVNHECTIISDFHTYSREIIDILRMKKMWMLHFSRTLLKWDLSNSMIINLLRVYIFTVGLMTFVSRSQVCQKFKLQIVLFRFLFRLWSAVVKCCMAVTYIMKIMHNMNFATLVSVGSLSSMSRSQQGLI